MNITTQFIQLRRAKQKSCKMPQCWLFVALVLLGITLAACQKQSPTGKIWYIKNQCEDQQGGIMSSNGQITTFDYDAKQEQTVVQVETAHSVGDAKFSPDGKYIVYLSIAMDDSVTLWLANRDGSNLQNIASASMGIKMIWLSDTQLLVLKLNKKDGRDWQTVTWRDDSEPELYDTVARQTSPLLLKTDIGFFSNTLSPEQEPEKLSLVGNIGFAHLTLNGNTIVQTSEMILNVSEYPEFSGPRWPTQTADGKKTAIQGSFGFQPYVDEIFLVTDNGQSVTRITNLGDDYSGVTMFSSAVSPNGKSILFIANLYYPHPVDRPSGVYVGLVDLDTKKVDLLTKQDNSGNVPIAWSPDSRYAVTSLVPLGRGGSSELYLIDIGTKIVKQITFDGGMKEVIGWR